MKLKWVILISLISIGITLLSCGKINSTIDTTQETTEQSTNTDDSSDTDDTGFSADDDADEQDDDSDDSDDADDSETSVSSASVSIPACTTDTTKLTHKPITTLSSIVPLGNSNPNGGHVFPSPHLYLYFEPHQDDGEPEPSTIDVFAPGNVIITRIQEMNYLTKEETDYSIYFSLCTDVEGYYMHVKRLSDEFKDLVGEFSSCNEYSTGGEDMKSCYKSLSLAIDSGTKIGEIGGSGQSNPQYNFDFGFRDKRIEKLAFINQTAYNKNYSSWYYITCALDYYDDPIKTELKSLLGYNDGTTFTQRTIEPICGENAQDIPNKLKGNWIKDGITEIEQEDPHVAFVDFNINPAKQTVSIGRESGVASNKALSFQFTPTDNGRVNRQFQDVSSDGNIYCYESEYNSQTDVSAQEHILVHMPTDTTLEVIRTTGLCPENPSTIPSPATFHR